MKIGWFLKLNQTYDFIFFKNWFNNSKNNIVWFAFNCESKSYSSENEIPKDKTLTIPLQFKTQMNKFSLYQKKLLYVYSSVLDYKTSSSCVTPKLKQLIGEAISVMFGSFILLKKGDNCVY